MTNIERIYVECVADDARKEVEKRAIINSDDKKLTIVDLRRIIRFYGGKLIKSTNPKNGKAYIIKDYDGFTVYYNNGATYLDILHELGHVFFDLENMEVGQIYHCEGKKFEDERSSLFARGFAMRRESFEKVVIANSKKGVFDVYNIANLYDIDYFDILTRIEELKIWG
jgi:Zn-dependent peptidase ImmA (M78 family)